MEYLLNRLVTCLKCMELACLVLQASLNKYHLASLSKNDDKEICFIKLFGFSMVFKKSLTIDQKVRCI